MKVYLVYTCKLEEGKVSVESVWQDEVKAIEHAKYWNNNMKGWHFWVDEREVRQ